MKCLSKVKRENMGFRTTDRRKCKYCDKPAKPNIINGRNKGYLRTCGSDVCLRANYENPEVLKHKSHFGINNGRFRPINTIRMTTHGYQQIKVADGNWQYIHIIVAEKMLGRPLLSDECVHHIDFNKLNNAPENLSVMMSVEHLKLHNKIDGLMKELLAKKIVKFENGEYYVSI